MDEEIWKIIQHDTAYAISNHGRVKRLTYGCGTYPGRVTFGSCLGDYLAFELRSLQGKRKVYLVHNLVTEAFLGAKPKGYQTHHIDENKQNNYLENLEYLPKGTHYWKHDFRNVKLSLMMRMRIDHSKELGFSNRATAKMIGVSRGCINNYVNGKTFQEKKLK